MKGVDIVKNIPVNGKGIELDDLYRSLPTQMVPCIYDSMISYSQKLKTLLHRELE